MVATDIVLAPSIAHRVATIKRYIRIAKKCYAFNNFNTSTEILCGLNLASVQRLKETWKAVPKKYTSILSNLTTIYTPDNNYKVILVVNVPKISRITERSSERKSLQSLLT
jgi:hypothetical protein